MPPTPKQIKEECKQRLQSVLQRLPANFIDTFMCVYPEYTEQRKHIYNVKNGRSLDVNVITKFEELNESIEKIKSNNH